MKRFREAMEEPGFIDNERNKLMTKVLTSEDCGNSPKNIFVQDLTIAFAKGDSAFLLSKVTDDIRWNKIGDTPIERWVSHNQQCEN